MFNKLYEEIYEIVKNNYLYIIGFFIGLAIMTIQLPYYINTPGGTSDISSKIEISDHEVTKNAFNMAYVSELHATLPTLIYSYFNKNWDVIKKENVIPSNEDKSDVKFRDSMMLNEANQEAIILAYTKANKQIEVLNKHFYVTYVLEDTETDLKVGDEILKINDIEINEYSQIYSITDALVENQKISIQVKNDDEITLKTATLMKEEDRLMIGILIAIDQEIKTIPDIKLKFKERDGGPSGGFMMSLAIYDTLTGSNLSQGRKIVGTGTIDEFGNVGQIGGVKHKIKGVVKDNVDIFFVPAGINYEEVMAVKDEKNYDITVVPIKTLDEAIEYLKNN